MKLSYTKSRDEEKRQTIFTLVIPDAFVRSVKEWKFSIILELINAMADPEDFITEI